MPWMEVSKVSLRLDFVLLALEGDANIRALCRQYGISPTTGYKWIHRYLREGVGGLQDQSRRPHTSPNQTPVAMEKKVLGLRDQHPAWGGRKIHRRLNELGVVGVPPPSTITEILRRGGRLDPAESRKHRPWQRFEAEAPNELWQMDFKGHFALADGSRCHPLTILDDHSRFCIGLQACANEQRRTVKEHLTNIFRRYGLPEQLLVDNGSPWGTVPRGRLTRLGVWLVHLGIRIRHTGSYHPQTIGKDERFHRTLIDEVIGLQKIMDLVHAQNCFDPWREIYNHERPHEALDLDVPSSRYQKSSRPFLETLPPIVYNNGDIVRMVDDKGKILYRNRYFRVGKALYGFPVALRSCDTDGVLQVYFRDHKVDQIDLRVYFKEH